MAVDPTMTLTEQHDEWQAGRCYFSGESPAQSDPEPQQPATDTPHWLTHVRDCGSRLSMGTTSFVLLAGCHCSRLVACSVRCTIHHNTR